MIAAYAILLMINISVRASTSHLSIYFLVGTVERLTTCTFITDLDRKEKESFLKHNFAIKFYVGDYVELTICVLCLPL